MGAKPGNKNALKHGLKESPTYYSWKSMKARCLNPKGTSYSHYGALGIKIYEPWLDFMSFLNDMGIRPKGKTLDRINPDGDYEPNNCKWSTPVEQQRNRRTIKPTRSGIQGVYPTSEGRWRVMIAFSGKNYCLGSFKDKEDAYMMRLAAEAQLL